MLKHPQILTVYCRWRCVESLFLTRFMIIFLLRASTINSEKGLKHEEPEQKQTF